MWAQERAAIERDQCGHRTGGDHSTSQQRIAHQRSVSQTSHRINPLRLSFPGENARS
jgi:hypothetical protein